MCRETDYLPVLRRRGGSDGHDADAILDDAGKLWAIGALVALQIPPNWLKYAQIGCAFCNKYEHFRRYRVL